MRYLATLLMLIAFSDLGLAAASAKDRYAVVGLIIQDDTSIAVLRDLSSKTTKFVKEGTYLDRTNGIRVRSIGKGKVELFHRGDLVTLHQKSFSNSRSTAPEAQDRQTAPEPPPLPAPGEMSEADKEFIDEALNAPPFDMPPEDFADGSSAYLETRDIEPPDDAYFYD